MRKSEAKKIVRERYRKIVKEKFGCGCKGGGQKESVEEKISKQIGYSQEELNIVGDANLGLGCGNPVAYSAIRPGDIVLDLGAGAGIDSILATKKVGPKGKVIGIDITEEMVEKAKSNAQKIGCKNLEFWLGDVEKLPILDNSINVIIANCVINLAPDKLKVLKEAYRVLRPGGKMVISDIVLLEELTERQKRCPDLIAYCVDGVILKSDYLALFKKAGFAVRILNENKDISKQQYQGVNLESITAEAAKAKNQRN